MDETTCSICHTPLPVDSRFCMNCGADLSDPESSTRQRTSLKELFETLRVAVEGRYRVTDMLGRGGMGAVFLAQDLRLGRRVAIKILPPEFADDHAFVKRFEREARIAAALDHPNIVPIYSVEQVGDFHYFVMKYVAGRSLDAILAEGPMDPEPARQILAQAATGLGHAHHRGVIHRDVKPSNIMLDESGRVLIADFGISKALEEATQYTSTGQMVGTPSYFSPEQAQGIPLDGRSDQYSLACVGYEMLVGKLPLEGENAHVLMYKHIYETPKSAAQVRPDVPADLSAALQRGLAKKPGERFGSMEEFAAAIRPGHSTADPALGQVVKVGRKRRRSLAVAVSVVTLLVVAAGLALWQTNRSAPTDSVQSANPPPPVTRDSAAPSPRQVAPAATSAAAADTAKASPSDTSAPPKPAPAPPRLPLRVHTQPASKSGRTGAVAPSPPRVGFLTVNAVPYGTVSIDGVEVGDTPIVRRQLPPGDHAVRITREGYRPQSVTVTITAGNEVRLSRTLQPAP